MNYSFPVINNISDVLPVIEGRDEFVVAEKDGGYTVINYLVAFDDTFPEVNTVEDAILRELRGMIFKTSTGEVLHRRYHKFFNCGERDETQPHKIDFSQPHVILEKLDGSMITPVWTNVGGRWGTKMGVTDVALPVEEFVANNPVYNVVAAACASMLATPIFEWCSRKQRIVIDYPQDMLVLTAVRLNNTGEYMPYKDLVELAEDAGIPVVKAYEGTADNMQALMDSVRDMTGLEGFIVRFDDGHMVKVKAEEYIQLHKTKDAISQEKNVVKLLVDDKIDDVKAFLSVEDLDRIVKFQHQFWQGVEATVHELDGVFASCKGALDKKDFAVNYVQKQDQKWQRFLYAMWDGKKTTLELVKDAIAGSCSTQSKVDDVRWMFNADWQYSFDGDV